MNLTETQKKLLQWLVEEVRAGMLEEEEIWFFWYIDGNFSLAGYKGDLRKVPNAKKTTLIALQSSGCLICDRSSESEYRCALTARAYETVDSNFGAPHNRQTDLGNITAGGDINTNVTQSIDNNSNKLAEKIGVVAQAGSTVNIDTLNFGVNNTIDKQVNIEQKGTNNIQTNNISL